MTRSVRCAARALPLALLLAGALAPDAAHAQGLLGRARRAAQRATERVVEREADRRATDATEQVLGAPGAGAAPAAAPAGTPGAGTTAGVAATEGALVNYDFVPGDRVLYADDFTADQVGDFPRRLEFISGNMEVAEWQGRRFVRATSWSEFAISLPADLTERFTLEFEAAVPGGAYQEVYFSEDPTHFVRFWPWEGGIESRNRSMSKPSVEPGPGVLFPIKVMADGDYVKVYMNGTRVANVPNAAIGRSRTIRFVVKADSDKPAFYGGFRVAEGGRDLHAVAEAVVAEPTPEAPAAPVVLNGVVFDTGSADLRAESGPTLDAVAASLVANPAVRVRVEGHTDTTGSADTNRTLSQARAAAVAAALAARGVAADRMEAQGFGPDQPVADNGTPEGRQQNRRVALVRL
jgi:OOP family OmpA-OmpF porin